MKEIPFNMSYPWGQSISSYLGTTLPELNANSAADPTLENAIQSTCAMIRDYSVKTLSMKNKKALTVFKDVCYGAGYLMHNKKLVMSGGCDHVIAPKDGEPLALGDGMNNIQGQCLNASPALIFKRDVNIPPLTTDEKKDIMNRMIDRAHLGGDPMPTLGGVEATDGAGQAEGYFLQNKSSSSLYSRKSKQTSNDDIPDYLNSELSGKGFSLNHTPHTRQVDEADSTLFHNSYNKAKDRPNNWYQYLMSMLFNKSDEDKAIGGEQENIILESDKRELIEIVMPDWFCPVICAGLDLEYLFSEELAKGESLPPVKQPAPVPAVNNPMSGEENRIINQGRYGVDPQFKKDNSVISTVESTSTAKDLDGNYKCSGVLPSALDCLTKGDLIAEWFAERMLNNDIMCNYEKRSCESVYG